VSPFSLKNGDDHPKAAHKHLQDAEVLLGEQRPDGAAYLSGYVVECALKSLLVVETGVAPRSHALPDLLTHLQQTTTAAGARTARYLGTSTLGLPTSAIKAWTPEMRYRAPSMTIGDAQAWHRCARDIYQETVHQMRLDGLI
jgi:HEPN domain-containing protein